MVYSEFIMFIQGPGCPDSKKGGSGSHLSLFTFISGHRNKIARAIGGFLEIDYRILTV